MASDKNYDDLFKNTQVEETLLKNSKGANYMSFILDVEIVIKKEEGTLNLAENMVRSKTQGGKEKGTKQTGEKREGKDSSTKRDEINAFSPQAQPTQVIHQKESGSPFLADANQENFAPGKRAQKDFDKIKPVSVEKGSKDDLNINENKEGDDKTVKSYQEKLGKKKRKSKIDQKAKIFKGKVEKIDFLECNRIFMCNYVKNPNFTISSTFLNSKLSSQYRYLKTKANSKPKSLSSPFINRQVLLSSQYSDGIFLSHTKSASVQKKTRFWQRGKTGVTSTFLSHTDITKGSEKSAGDSNLRWELGDETQTKLSINENEELSNQSSFLSYHVQMPPQVLNELGMRTFNAPIVNIDPIHNDKEVLQTDTENHCYSEQKLKYHREQKSKNSRKSWSSPDIMIDKVGIISDGNYQIENDFRGKCKGNEGSNHGKEEIGTSTDDCNGLTDLHIQFFNETEELITPQVNIINGTAELECFSGVNPCKIDNLCMSVSKHDQNEKLKKRSKERVVSSMTNKVSVRTSCAMVEKQSNQRNIGHKIKCNHDGSQKTQRNVWYTFRQFIMCK